MSSLFTGELLDNISVRQFVFNLPSCTSAHLTLRAALESDDQRQRINRDHPHHPQP